MEHTIVERKIKRDILEKNAVLKKVRKMKARVSLWESEAKTSGNRRREKKYRATSRRFMEEISLLQVKARKMIEDLDDRIHEELKFSGEEVGKLKDQLAGEKEIMEEEPGKIGKEKGSRAGSPEKEGLSPGGE